MRIETWADAVIVKAAAKSRPANNFLIMMQLNARVGPNGKPLRMLRMAADYGGGTMTAGGHRDQNQFRK
jgi:hypothetical protein